MIPTSFNASRSHSSGRNFIFLWDGQVHLFSYSRIESESTTTLVTKATNTRLKQQTFQPAETKKFLNLYFVTLGVFHSPSGQGVAWFKEQGEKNPFWKHIHHCHIALNTPCSPRPLFPISQGGGGRVCLRELNKMIGAYGQCENGESNKKNLQISTELKNLISATQILFTLEFLYAWICWLGEWGEVGW